MKSNLILDIYMNGSFDNKEYIIIIDEFKEILKIEGTNKTIDISKEFNEFIEKLENKYLI